MPFFSSFTGSFAGGRRIPIGVGGGGGGAATYSLDGASVSSTYVISGAAPNHFQFNADGTEITTSYNNWKQFYTVSLSSAYDPTTGSYSTSDPTVNLGITAGTAYGFRYNDDGTKAFFTHQTILSPSRGQVTEFSLSTPYDIFTVSSGATTAYDTEGDFAATDLLNINSIAFNADGTKMFLQNNSTISGVGIFEYDLSSAYTLSTASYSQGYLYTSVLPADLLPSNILFNNAGTKLYVTDFRYDSIYEFDLSTGFDLSTISYNNVSLSFAATDTFPNQMVLSQDETQMYIQGKQNNNIYTLDLVQDAGFGGGGAYVSTFDADLLNVDAGVTNVSTPYVYLSPDGSTAVFAEPRWDSSSGLGEDWGRIHIFNSSGGSWQFVQSVFPPSSAQTNGYTLYRTYFGEGVALSNDGSRIAVNGPNHGNTGSNASQYGAIWILDRQGDGTYSEAYRISRSRSSNWNAERGISITPDGNTISLASWNDGSSATDYVMADVYGYNSGTDSWDKQAGTTAFSRNVSLRSSGQNNYSGEGYSKLSEDGNYCLFFAEEAWHFSTAGGYAAVGYWDGNTWVTQAELNPGSVTRYGASGDINSDGSVLVVSDNDRPATNAGQIHIWRRSGATWTKEQTIVNPTSNANSYTRRFGQNVRMNSAGTSIAVLAAQSGEGETATIYFYDYDAGTQTWGASSQGDIDTGFTDAFYGSLTYTDLIMDATKDLGLIVLGDAVRNTLQFYERPGGGFGGS